MNAPLPKAVWPQIATPAPAKPLYIVASERVQIDVKADALVVKQGAKGPRYFPFARVSRVVCNRNCDWTGAALVSCLDRRITISFLTRATELVGYCLPHVSQTEPFHTCMEKFASSPRAAACWNNWFRHRRMWVLSRWAKGREAVGTSVPDDAFCEMKRRFVYLSEQDLHLDLALRGPFQALVVERLNREGARCSYPPGDNTTLPLLESLVLLLWGEVNMEAGALVVAVTDRRLQWLFLESWMKGHGSTLDEHLIALKHFIVRERDLCH